MSGLPSTQSLDRGLAFLATAVLALFIVSLAFAMIALALRIRNDRIDARHRRLVTAWEPAVLDVLAGSASASVLADKVQQGDHFYYLTFLQGYAARLRGGERAMIRRLARPYLQELAARAPKGNAEQRGLALQVLAGIGMPEQADVVASALDDPSPFVAMIAARGLFRRGQETYFPIVLRHLSRFTLWSRSFLSSMLARGGPGAASLLRDMLDDPTQPAAVRTVSADSLRLLNDVDSVGIAVKILRAETDRDLVAACLRLVRHLGHRDHVPVVRPLVASPDPVIRATAVGALGAIGGPDEIPLLQDVLDDVAFWVSLQAARGLMALGDIATLRRLATTTGPWSVLAQQVLSE